MFLCNIITLEQHNFRWLGRDTATMGVNTMHQGHWAKVRRKSISARQGDKSSHAPCSACWTPSVKFQRSRIHSAVMSIHTFSLCRHSRSDLFTRISSYMSAMYPRNFKPHHLTANRFNIYIRPANPMGGWTTVSRIGFSNLQWAATCKPTYLCFLTPRHPHGGTSLNKASSAQQKPTTDAPQPQQPQTILTTERSSRLSHLAVSD